MLLTLLLRFYPQKVTFVAFLFLIVSFLRTSCGFGLVLLPPIYFECSSISTMSCIPLFVLFIRIFILILIFIIFIHIIVVELPNCQNTVRLTFKLQCNVSLRLLRFTTFDSVYPFLLYCHSLARPTTSPIIIITTNTTNNLN